MRFMFFLVLLSAAAFAGWIAGSFHPAPRLILDPIEQFWANVQQDASLYSQPERPNHDIVPESSNVSSIEPEIVPSLEPEPENEVEPVPETEPIAELRPSTRQAQYRIWIAEARETHPYPESVEKMHAVMMCESGGRADIINPAGPYSGLFQYSASTWSGDWNHYRDTDILDARAQIFATALAWSKDMQSHWGCYHRSH